MKLADLSAHLKATNRLAQDDKPGYGPNMRAAITKMLEDGPDTPLTARDFETEALALGVQSAAIRAFWKVEANGAGFQNGMPKILPEPHRFSKNTAHLFDVTNPTLSYPKWGTRPYPPTQAARYAQLLDWIGILAARGMDIDAAFASASYGAPQIMGENYKACGFKSAVAFAEAMSRDEPQQLQAFGGFVTSAGILPYLRKVGTSAASWEAVAQRYNGTGYRQNSYHIRMAQAFALYGGHD